MDPLTPNLNPPRPRLPHHPRCLRQRLLPSRILLRALSWNWKGIGTRAPRCQTLPSSSHPPPRFPHPGALLRRGAPQRARLAGPRPWGPRLPGPPVAPRLAARCCSTTRSRTAAASFNRYRSAAHPCEGAPLPPACRRSWRTHVGRLSVDRGAAPDGRDDLRVRVGPSLPRWPNPTRRSWLPRPR